MIDTVGIDLFLGLDLGKEFHHAHGLTGQGKTVHDRRLPNTEPKLRELFEKLVAKFGAVLVVVDQVANIGALPIAAARASGCRIAYLPGLSMRRAADLYPGEAKTDARDAFVIADTARTMPHILRAVDRDDEKLAELTMITGYDNDLAGEVNRTTNRLRGLLSQIHPSLERVVGPRLAYPYIQALLQRHGSPAKLKKLGRARCEALLKAHGSRKAHHLTTEIFDALAEQTLVVPGTEASALIVPGLAAQLAAAHTQRRQAEQEIAALLEALPLFHLLTSLPGMGVRTTAAVIVAIGDGATFPTAGHLASYAGLAPATKSSGTSIRGEHAPHRGNRLLKRALFQAAFAAIGCKSDPSSRTYYDRQRARGKTHTQAILRLARQRVNVIHAMIRTGALYEPRTPDDVDLAA
ncbi:IS110 family transposase (plasmid) [Streptomyces sp. NBC_00853]|uniref:IS110 family transposase n=2 Tax=unclassified Streptomyces TaxID=2593676 RepID=UPI002F91B875|nr:IS110 family transposase [Streptomyces sp. NBC_00853]WTA16639.1 IS110 family transposase [Streptomyces sp. NBC_00853]WTA16783.1 IS110 family transposase [Streptomyces sp. NBC_00853]WTA17216.1 IS110 family transposase [Streptomyces sp. NBC_00853]WTA18598.1 IS110 family transposase [Streptomyces sp. NBC_00853]